MDMLYGDWPTSTGRVLSCPIGMSSLHLILASLSSPQVSYALLVCLHVPRSTFIELLNSVCPYGD